MKNIFRLPLILVVFLLSACEDPSLQRQNKDSNSNESNTLSAKEKSWPPAGKETRVLENDLAKKNYYVILDNSGSMNNGACNGQGTKMDNAKIAMREFVKSVPQNANLGLMTFHGEKVGLGTGDQNRRTVMTEVETAEPKTGTPLSWAIKEAYEKITSQARRQLGYGEYYLVVVTDGESTDGDPKRVLDKVISESPVVVYTVGFCIGSEHSLNQPGRTVYKEANDLLSLRSGLKEVLAESEKFDISSFQK